MLSNGAALKFNAVTVETGILATSDPFIIKEIDAMIAQQRGGVFRIGQAEYEELKKNRISTQPWREEVGHGGYEVNRQSQRSEQPNPGMDGRAQATAQALAASSASPPVAADIPSPMFRPKASK